MGKDVEKLVIYDLGANTGDDLEYYLLKADLVVAVEANPVLAAQIRERYADAIEADRLRVENCVVVSDHGGGPVKFYINRRSHLCSRVEKPSLDYQHDSDPELYDEVELPAIGVRELVERHGDPYYIKMDLEYYDAAVLRVLFENGIIPPLISVEAHDVEIFTLLVALGGYDCFKLVDGSQVGFKYANHPITTRDGPGVFSFPNHAAGPFGDDLPGIWRESHSFSRHLALPRLGWKDIHASRIHTPVPRETLIDYVIVEHMPAALRSTARGLLNFASKIANKRKKLPPYITNPAALN